MLDLRLIILQDVLMTLSEELRSIINNYFERNPYMSINGLANKSGVGATTLRRIMHLSIKGDPAPHTVLNIVSTIYKEKSLSKLLTLVEGKIAELLRKCFGSYANNDLPHKYDPDFNEILHDKINYLIYKLAANRTGTSAIEISELFGQVGKDRLDNLLELGLVIKENDRIHAKDKNFSLDISVAKKHLPELIQFYKPKQVAMEQNIFYTLSESINEEGIKKIKEIQKEAVKKTYEVMNCPFYEGNIPYFTINLGDTLSLNQQYGAIQ